MWPTQNFGWVGHNAFGPTDNWPACSLILRKISKIWYDPALDFKAKMRQICFPLGLAVFNGPTFKGREREERNFARFSKNLASYPL